jgi:hypothetical protein
MAIDQKTVRTLYRKLLALYSRVFREQLGESMEQTFNDLCHERKRQTERGLFGFVLWLFVETAMEIIKEHVLLIKQGDTMKSITTNLRSAAIISFILVPPFMMLELVNRRNLPESFPVRQPAFLPDTQIVTAAARWSVYERRQRNVADPQSVPRPQSSTGLPDTVGEPCASALKSTQYSLSHLPGGAN